MKTNRRGYIYTPSSYSSGRYTRRDILIEGYSPGGRIGNLRQELQREKPDVFVSHKSEDEDIAKKVASTIAKCDLKAYLDVWDPNVDGDGDGPELVDYISSVIGCCESLIAVVSHNTVRSWWVPLEIGIAITKDLYLGTFLDSDHTRNFPSYLWKWPVLKDMDDLENWCRERETKTTPQRFYESLRQNHAYMFRR